MAALAGYEPGISRPDPLDPTDAPFGAFAPGPWLARARRAALSRGLPALLKGWAYTLLAHFTTKRRMVVDVVYDGFRRRLFLDDSGHDRWIFRKDLHPEEEDMAIFAPYAGQGAVFLDIGANVGYYALRASRDLGPGSRVISFEPHPRTVSKLKLNLALNDNRHVEVIEAGLGPSRGAMKMRIVQGDEGSNAVLLDGSGAASDIEVPVLPLLDFLREAGVERIDILKIDVEGFEDRVLAPFFDAAPESLYPKEMLLETTHGADAQWEVDLRALLKARGYRLLKTTRDNDWLVREAA